LYRVKWIILDNTGQKVVSQMIFTSLSCGDGNHVVQHGPAR